MVSVEDRLTDSAVLALVRDPLVTKVGIDAPFGWPIEFVDAVTAYCDEGRWPVEDPSRLALRETDLRVRELTRQQPLSVSTGWLAWPAMRCAGLLAQLAEGKDRTGRGKVVEVYPAAALRRWGMSPSDWPDDPGGYKGPDPASAERRRRLAAMISSEVSGRLRLSPGFVERLEESDDELDAFICALVVRAVEVGRSEPIPEHALERAEKEGWIHLPLDEPLSASLGS